MVGLVVVVVVVLVDDDKTAVVVVAGVVIVVTFVVVQGSMKRQQLNVSIVSTNYNLSYRPFDEMWKCWRSLLLASRV